MREIKRPDEAIANKSHVSGAPENSDKTRSAEREYKRLVDYAQNMVCVISRQYSEESKLVYLPLLMGVGPCKVEGFPGAGHNYRAVIDAIHYSYSKDSDSHILEGYRYAIEELIKRPCHFKPFSALLKIIFYQLEKEKEGTSVVILNNESMLKQIDALLYEKDRISEKRQAAGWDERRNC